MSASFSFLFYQGNRPAFDKLSQLLKVFVHASVLVHTQHARGELGQGHQREAEEAISTRKSSFVLFPVLANLKV